MNYAAIHVALEHHDQLRREADQARSGRGYGRTGRVRRRGRAASGPRPRTFRLRRRRAALAC